LSEYFIRYLVGTLAVWLLLLFLNPGSEIRDPGWVKIRIRDKHPGSATLDSGEKNCTSIFFKKYIFVKMPLLTFFLMKRKLLF
jgi:hypothetical protein